MSASASASASASTSTNPPSNLPSQPPSSSNNASASTSHSHAPSNPQSASPTLPHSPETARQIAEARAALEASMTNIGSSLDHSLKSRAQNLHSNSAALEKQQNELVKNTEKMRKETDKLKKVADEGARRVKELGNVQNWAEMLERDFLVLGETMRLVRKGDGESGWDGKDEGWETSSGSGSWSSEDGIGDGERERVREEDHHMEGTGLEDASTGAEHQNPANGNRLAGFNDADDKVRPVVEEHEAVDADGEGDFAMDAIDQQNFGETSKGKQLEPLHQVDVAEGSSTTATTGSGSTSTADPSSTSVHTAASTRS